MLTPAGLVIALVLSAPALVEAADGSLGLGTALLRLLAAFVLVAIGTAVLRRVLAPQPVRPVEEPVEHPARRRDDA